MPDLTIRIKKKTDGSAALSCTRADGSVTWQRQDGQLGRFFPLHDLTHYCVESVLGFDRAFYGLVAAGWDISDFGKPEYRSQDFSEALLGEVIVGMFDLERITGERGDAADLAEKIALSYESRGQSRPDISVTQEQIDQIRALARSCSNVGAAFLPATQLRLSSTAIHPPARTQRSGLGRRIRHGRRIHSPNRAVRRARSAAENSGHRGRRRDAGASAATPVSEAL